jgi:hypothetical protein
LRREALRQGDRRLFTFLAIAFALKIAATVIRHVTIFEIFRGDAIGYHGAGVHIMTDFRAGIFETGLESYTDTDFISLLTGLLYTVIGPTSYGGFFFYSWIAFLGLFLCYRAFVIAVPDGRSKTYGRLVFLLPSMLYWPSSIGKEAWMLLAIGIAAFGAARVLSGRALRGLPIVALGMWMGAMIRPHVPAMLGVALILAFAVGRRHNKFRSMNRMVKLVTLVLLLGGGALLLSQTASFLNADISSIEGITSTLEQTSERADNGGSEFDPPVVKTPLDIPFAFVSVLYRPFLFEATNALALVSAIEGGALLLFSVWRLRWAFSALKKLRVQPYIAFSVLYLMAFVVAFSSIPNFGLLARQRVQVYPFLFVLLCVPYVKKLRESSSGDKPYPEARIPEMSGR